MLTIRHFYTRDLEDILFLEKEVFVDDAWSESNIKHYLKDREHLGLVAEVDGVIVGYYIYRYTTYRYDIVRIAVSNKWRRRKIGSAMIERLLSKLGNNTAKYQYKRFIINVVVPDDNLTAQLFFQNFGFTADAVVGSGYLMRYRFNPEYSSDNTFVVDSLTGVNNG